MEKTDRPCNVLVDQTSLDYELFFWFAILLLPINALFSLTAIACQIIVIICETARNNYPSIRCCERHIKVDPSHVERINLSILIETIYQKQMANLLDGHLRCKYQTARIQKNGWYIHPLLCLLGSILKTQMQKDST